MKELIVMVCLVVAFIWGLLLWADSQERSACYKTGKHTGYPVRYPDYLNFDEGCFIQVNGRWVPLKNWRPE